MIKQIIVISLLLLTAYQAAAADLGTPQLSDSTIGHRFFDLDRLLTSGGIKYTGAGQITMEPQLGLGYTARELELGSGFEQSIHKVHAQAGGRFNLGGAFFFSAAAKAPVYTYEISDRRFGESASQGTMTHQTYDFTRFTRLNNLTWTGEIGIRLGRQTELNLYYDQTQFDSFQPGLSRPEERFGTRFIFRFK